MIFKKNYVKQNNENNEKMMNNYERNNENNEKMMKKLWKKQWKQEKMMKNYEKHNEKNEKSIMFPVVVPRCSAPL